jgi:predicted chitinase
MLDRFANRAEEANYTERAAAFLAQAAKECGGFYERYAHPNRAAAPASQ